MSEVSGAGAVEGVAMTGPHQRRGFDTGDYALAAAKQIAELHAECRRYREALGEIARLENVSAADRAVNVAGQTAREALDRG